MRLTVFFAWYDFWIGVYYSRREHALYVCPLPCIVFKFVAAQQVAEADRAGSPVMVAAKVAERIALYSGVVDGHDGAYDWVRESEYGLTENSLGFHKCPMGETYTVLELL